MTVLQRVEAFWFAPHSAAPAALIRILVGLWLVLAWTMHTHNMEFWYGHEGVAQYFNRGGEDVWIADAWPQLHVALIASAAMFSLGVATPLAGVVAATIQGILIDDFGSFTWGWANVVPLFIYYLVAAGAGRAWSVDAWLIDRWRARSGRPAQPAWTERTVRGWAMRLLQVNICAVYLAAAWHRVDDPSWIDGDIVWEAAIDSQFTRTPHVDFMPFKPLLMVLSYMSWALEGLGVFLLWVPRLGPWWALGCICMHLGLELSASVGWWQFVMGTGLLSFVWPTVSQRVLTLPGAVARRLGR